MSNWQEDIPRLEAVLAKHFPRAPAKQRNKWANTIQEAGEHGETWEWLVRANTTAKDDRDNLVKAAKDLRSAAGKLRQTGWHGSLAVLDLAKLSLQKDFALPTPPLMGPRHAGECLAAPLDALASRIEACAESVDINAAHVMGMLDADLPTGRPANAPTKPRPYEVAGACYDAFFALANRTPAISVDWDSHKAGGPFHAFISDTFGELGIKANAEYWGGKVRKEKRRQTKE